MTIIVNIVYIPLDLAFNVNHTYYSVVFSLLPTCVFVLEILLNFNTAYYDQGQINYKRKSIILNYLKGSFPFDLLVTVPFFLSNFIGSNYLNLILMLRVKRIQTIFAHIEDLLNLRVNYSTFLDTVRLIFVILLVSHYTACAWFFISKDDPYSWIIENQLQFSSTESKYINSLYWSVITILTVGYGDITPVTDKEKVFVMVMSFITCGVFGYSINHIGEIYKGIQEKQTQTKNFMSKIQAIFCYHKTPKDLQIKIKKYFDYYLKLQQDELEDVNYFITKLTPELKKEVMVNFYKTTLFKNKFFREMLSEECLKDLCLKVQEKKYHPDQKLFKKGEVTKKLFYIKQGSVSVICSDKHNKTPIKLRQFIEGFFIGNKNFIQNQPMQYTGIAKTFTSVLYLEYDDFLQVLKQHPQDLEQFCSLRDHLIYQNSGKIIVSVCEICGCNHSMLKCPYVFFQPNKNKIISQYCASYNQDRIECIRKLSRNRDQLGSIQQQILAFCLLENIMEEKSIDDKYLIRLGFSKQILQNLLMENISDFDVDFQKEILQKAQNGDSKLMNSPNKDSSLQQEYSSILSQSSKQINNIEGNEQIQQQNSLKSQTQKSHQESLILVNSQKYIRKSQKNLSHVSQNNQQSLLKVLDKFNETTSGTNKDYFDQELEEDDDKENNQINAYWSVTSIPRRLSDNQLIEDKVQDFESGKEYQIYFPQSNLSCVLFQIQEIYARQSQVKSTLNRHMSIFAKKKQQFQSNLSNIMRKKSKTWKSRLSQSQECSKSKLILQQDIEL